MKTYCEICREPVEDGIDIVDGLICDSCAENYSACHYCDRQFQHDSLYYSDVYGENYCDDCYDELFTTCDSCGEEISRENVYESSQGTYCRDCWPNTDGGWVFHGRGGLYFGIELECGIIKDYPLTCAEVQQVIPAWVQIGGDSSILECIDVKYAFEFRTHPATYDWLMAHKADLEPLFALRNKGLRSYTTNTCGIHIHISKKAISSAHLLKLMELIYENYDFILAVSQREESRLDRWGNIYRKRAGYKVDANDRYASKCWGLSVNNVTCEFRIFRGTLKPESFWKNVEFVQAALEYTKSIESSDEITEAKDLIKYIKENKDRFENLYNFLCKKIITGDLRKYAELAM